MARRMERPFHSRSGTTNAKCDKSGNGDGPWADRARTNIINETETITVQEDP